MYNFIQSSLPLGIKDWVGKTGSASPLKWTCVLTAERTGAVTRKTSGERWAHKGELDWRRLGRYACTAFHLFFKWRGYPRTLREDKRCFRQALASWYITRPDGPRIFWLLLPYSDRMSSTGFESHDPYIELGFKELDDPLFIRERAIKSKWAFSLVLFGAYLKRTGDFGSAERFYNTLTKIPGLRAEGYLGLADIHHLLADWNLELDRYRAANIYPDPPLATAEDAVDFVARMKSFDHKSAAELYRMASKASPKAAYPRVHWARALASAGLKEEAARVIDEAASLAPDSAIIRLYQSYMHGLVGRTGWKEKYRSAVGRSPFLTARQHEVVRAEIITSKEAARRLGAPIIELTPARSQRYSYTIVLNGVVSERKTSLSFDIPLAVELPQISDLGLGLKLAAGKYLISDSRGLDLRQAKMFCPDVLAHDEEVALIGRANRMVLEALPRNVPIFLPGAMFNYFHWMFDGLGALCLYGDHVNLNGREVLCAKPIEAYHLRTIKLLFSNCRLRTMPNLNTFTFERAVHLGYPSRLNVPHPTVIARLRSKLSRHAERPKPGRRVYITRKNLPGREALNEAAIMRRLRDTGFEVCDPGKMSFDEQVEFFADVEAVAAAPGAALTNLILCPSETKVLLLASALHHFETFTLIAGTIGQPTYACFGTSVTVPNSFFVWSVFQYTINERDLCLALGAAGLS